MSWETQVIAVTGAGSGIGEAVAKKLAGLGAAVVVADVTVEGGTRVAEEITASGGRASFKEANIADEAGVDAMIRHAVATFGAFTGAVNNAGVGQPFLKLHEVSTADWDRVHNVDLRGLFFCMRAEITHFLANGGGRIVNVASGAGLKAALGQASYVAAKHGVVGLTRQAAIEYVADDIRVNAVAPGLVLTPQMLSYPKEAQEAYAALMPIGRAAQPEEIANAVAWLLSDEASYVSGDILEVDAAYMQK